MDVQPTAQATGRYDGLDLVLSRLATRRGLFKGALAGGLAIGGASLLAACGANPAPGVTGGAAGSTLDSLTWGIAATVRGLDPATSADTYSFTIDSLFYETLVTYDNSGKVIPALAETVTPSADLKSYTYKLRPGVTFSDGTPLTAEDVVFSIQRNIDPAVGSQISGFFGNVDKVTATGDNEVTVTMKTPDALFQYIPAFTFILSKAFVTQAGKNFGTPFTDKPTVLGTGPFVPTSFQADQGLKLKQNPSYWGQKTSLSTMNVSILPTPSTRQLALKSAKIDGTFDVPLATAKAWTDAAGAQLVTAEGLAVFFISLDVETPPFDDVHFRRAIAYCLDNEGVVKSQLGGNGKVATSVVPEAMWRGMRTDTEIAAIYKDLTTYGFDIEKAKAELAQSKYASGASISVQFPSNRPDEKNTLLSLKENLAKIGVTLDVKEVTSDNWLNTIYAHKRGLGMQVMKWLPDYPDPADYLQYFYPSSAAVANQFNMANFKNATVDELLAKQNSSIDVGVRTDAIAKIMQLSQEEVPYIPVWWENVAAGVRNGVTYQGLNAMYYNQPWFRNVT